MTKVYDALSGAKVVSLTGIGIYYDDPAIISGELLRSDVGSVINPKDAATVAKNLYATGVRINTLSAGTKVVITFPLRNSISYMIGPMKVYPVMTKYMKEKGYNLEVPRVEVYDMTAKKIYYIADIVK